METAGEKSEPSFPAPNIATAALRLAATTARSARCRRPAAIGKPGRTALSFLGRADTKIPSGKLVAVVTLDRLFGGVLRRELDERKASGSTRNAVGGNEDLGDLADFGENRLELAPRRVITHISNEHFASNDGPPNSLIVHTFYVQRRSASRASAPFGSRSSMRPAASTDDPFARRSSVASPAPFTT